MVLDKHHREQHQQLPEPLGYEPVVLLHMGKQLLFAADKKAAYLSGTRHGDLRYLLEFKHSRIKKSATNLRRGDQPEIPPHTDPPSRNSVRKSSKCFNKSPNLGNLKEVPIFTILAVELK